MIKYFICTVLLAVSLNECSGRTSYDGWSLIRAKPRTENQVVFINSMLQNESSSGVQSWLPGDLQKPYDIVVSPEAKDRVVAQLQSEQIAYEILIENLQSAMEAERTAVPSVERAGVSFTNSEWFSKFLSLNEITAAIQKLARNHPGIVKTETIGKTHEGRPLTLVTVSANSSSQKPAIWLDGGIHAREWVSPATVLYILNKLVTEYNSSNTIKGYVNSATFYIVPVLNPDGYNHAFEKDRMWRKNRRPKECIGEKCCQGADLNRNFDHAFGGAGTSPNPCVDIYPGPSAFSEPESKAVRDFLTSHKDVKAYISLHSYSQMWFFPYGSRANYYPADVKELEDVAKRGAAALEAVHGTKYEVGSAADLLYESGGGSDDWAKSEAGIKYSYTLELRPGRNYPGKGFILPPSEILPTGEETWAGLSVVFEAVIGSNRTESSDATA